MPSSTAARIVLFCTGASPQREPSLRPASQRSKPDGESQNHVFRAKVFKKPRPCHLCHQPIHQLGSCCRVCKYVCHKACESKYIKETQRSKAKTATLSSTINTSVNNNISTLPNNNSSSNNNSGSVGSVVKHGGRSGSNGSAARRARARSKDSMDLRYVTERIIALWVPGDASRAAYLQGQQQAASMLHTKHADNYMVFNLSAPRRSLRRHHHSVRELGWPRDLAPPLERLCSICKDMDSWLKGNSRRIAVVHARGSKDRIRVVVAAYMHYSQICGGADQALDRFAMKRFLQDQVDDVEQPSHRRYVDYFSGLLSGAIKINSAPLYLTHVTVLGAPSFEPSHPDGPDPGGGCRAFLKVYEGLVPVHTSAVYCVAEGARAFTVNVAAERGRRGLQLRGDVLVKCYHRHYSKRADPTDAVHNKEAREIVFACQFHSCAVSDYTLSFTRSELDYACDDLRFPLDGAVALHFSPTPEPRLPSPAPTPSVPTQDSSDDPVTRWDSYEHLAHLGGGSEEEDDDVTSEQDDDLSHTYGPLDGSLYATVGRKQQLQQLQQLHQQHIQMQQENPYRQRQLLLQQQQDHHLHLHQQRSRQLPQQHLHTPLSATSGASPGSEHTISMDSGISSAGNGGSAQTHSQRALDDLLSDMLLNVENFPDLKPASTPASTPAGRADLERAQRSGGEARNRRRAPTAAQAHSQSSLSAALQQSVPAPALAPAIAPSCLPGATVVRMPSADTELGDIPYHARLDGRPFTYVSGASPPAMAPSGPTPNGLSSPSLVRRAAAHQNGYATSTPRPHNDNPAWTSPSPPPRYYDDLLLADGVGGLGGPAARGHLTWLQRQQQKLRERREGLLRSSRQPQEARLLSELRSLQHAHSASRRPDGYTSDTTTFADEDDEDLCRPLHINTGKLNGVVAGGLSAPGSPLQRRAAPPAQSALPYPLSRQKSDSSFDRERPFVAVKHTNKYHDSPREESCSSWRSEEGRFSRPQTPAFPVQPRTPYSNNGYLDLAGLPPKSPTTQRKDRSPSPMSDAQSHATYMQHSPKSPVGANGGQSSPTVHSRRSSTHSNSEPPQEVAAHHVKFVRDTSRFWYKPNISREEAIALLRESPPGTFVVRDSNSFLGAFGLALRVSVPPATVAQKAAFFSGDASELVRHFLIEPTSRGVKLKGCTNEPVFSSLSALVYQHSIMAMALPCKLVLPDGELGGVGAVQARHVVDLGASPTSHSPQGPLNSTQQLLAQGAACNVLYLLTTDTESLTGPQAIRRVVHQLFSSRPPPSATVVHFKVSSQGITLTDNKRRLFFRRHYPVSTISHCGLDPDDHRWSQKSPDTGMPISSNRCFGFVARKPTSRSDNQCHIFAELEPEQPANAIVNFVVKVMMSGAGQRNNV